MWAYSYTDTDAASFDVMSGEEIALRENGRWEPSERYYWRWYAGQKLGFIACVPDPADNLTPPSDPAGSFVYETDPDLQKQQDLLIASIAGVTGADYEKTGVPLVFKHVLTAIRFRVSTTATGMELRNIRSISLRNVRYKGSFRVNGAGRRVRDSGGRMDAPTPRYIPTPCARARDRRPPRRQGESGICRTEP